MKCLGYIPVKFGGANGTFNTLKPFLKNVEVEEFSWFFIQAFRLMIKNDNPSFSNYPNP
jgi:hypothetical protein